MRALRSTLLLPLTALAACSLTFEPGASVAPGEADHADAEGGDAADVGGSAGKDASDGETAAPDVRLHGMDAGDATPAPDDADTAPPDASPDDVTPDVDPRNFPADWWDRRWPSRLALTFDNTTGQTLTDLVVPVFLTANRVPGLDGLDLHGVSFVDGSGALLPREREGNAPRPVMWVRVPVIEPGATTRIWMYVGGPTRDDDRLGVWRGYSLVVHGQGDAQRTVDSGPLGYHGVLNNGAAHASGDDLAASFLRLDGVDDWVTHGNHPELDARPDGNHAITVSLWYRFSGDRQRDEYLAYKEAWCVGWSLLIEDDDELNAVSAHGDVCDGDERYQTVEDFNDTDDGVWHHAVFTYDRDASKVALYRDGALEQRRNLYGQRDPQQREGMYGELKLGTQWDSSEGFFGGDLDEVRVRPGVIGEVEQAVEHRAMRDQGFVVFGAPETP